MGIFTYNLTEGTAIKTTDAEHPSGAPGLGLQVTAGALLGQNPYILSYMRPVLRPKQGIIKLALVISHKEERDGL